MCVRACACSRMYVFVGCVRAPDLGTFCAGDCVRRTGKHSRDPCHPNGHGEDRDLGARHR